MATKRQKTDTRHLMQRGSIWYVQARLPDGRRLVQSTGETDLTAARSVRDHLLEPLALSDTKARLAAVQASITSVEDRLTAIQDAAPSLPMLAAWRVFVDMPKGKTGRGRRINPGERTLADYEGRWGAFCDWMEGAYPKHGKSGKPAPRELREVTPEQARHYIRDCEKAWSPNTRNKTLSFLRLFFSVLSDVARVQDNPFAGMEATPHSTAKKSNLTLSQLTAISKQLEGAGEIETLFALGFYTGARLGDCCNFRWSDFDIEAGKLTFTPHKTDKGRNEIRMAIHPALLRILQKTPPARRKGVLLPETCKLYNRDSSAVCGMIQKVFIAAGIETSEAVKGYGHRVARIGFHSLRHSYITGLIEAGVDMDTVRRQAGHSTIGMTAHYYHGEQAAQGASLKLPDISNATVPPLATGTAGSLGAVLDGLRALDAAGLQAVLSETKRLIKEGVAM